MSERAEHESGWRRALAPAKVNLTLDVLGRRADGYHELDTTMVALGLADVLGARRMPRTGLALRLSGPHAGGIPGDERNLAWRAAAAVLDAAERAGALGRGCGLELELAKEIPDQAGLGGGSSDAAAALLAAEAALGFELDARARRAVLAELGSDCVFFLEAAATGFARCRGRGEQVEPWAPVFQEWSVALIAPEVRVPTAAVYAALGRSLYTLPRAPNVRASPLSSSEHDARAALRNALEPAALALFPDLRAWRRLLDECGASHFRLCGSGSSFFGLYRSAEQAALELAAIETLARSRGTSTAMKLRGSWTAPLAGHGARVLP